MTKILQLIHDAGLIFRYQVNGEWFLQFPTAQKHQKLSGNMKDESDFPSPPQEEYQKWLSEVRKDKSIPKSIPVHTGMNPGKNKSRKEKRREGKGIEEKGRENKGRESGPAAAPETDPAVVVPVSIPPPDQALQQELGRPLTPMEAKRVEDWLKKDQFAPDVVTEAVKRAVVQGKLTLAYVDGILQNWHGQELKTIAEVLDYEKKRRGKDPPKEDKYAGVYEN